MLLPHHHSVGPHQLDEETHELCEQSEDRAQRLLAGLKVSSVWL